MDEFDPTAELGLTHDKQLICSCKGFLQYNDSSRDLCGRFVDHGEKLYDLISRYDDLVAYALNRSDGRSGSTARFAVPFLKAYGVTDFTAMECCRDSMKLMTESKRVMKHLTETLPTFITTSSYEHNVINLCDAIGFPRVMVDCGDVGFDEQMMNRQEARAIREMASKITSLRMPSQEHTLGVPYKFKQEEVDLVTTLDGIFNDKLKDTPGARVMRQYRTVGANEKAYFLIDLRKRTGIDFDGTAYVGGDITDIHALDTVRDRGGLALSFNGCDLSVRRSNIAVMSRDCTVAAVLVQEFYNEGIEAVFDLVENWNRESLEKKDFPDPYLMSAMLNANKKKLPEVHIVDRDNMDEIAKKSDKYRRNLFNK
jgi:predicted HAD superfamily phosphohydrolase